MTDSLTIVTPLYNEAKGIERFLDAILNLSKSLAQRDIKTSVLLVDDGSDDDGARIAAEWGDKHGELPMHLLRLSRNFGKEQALAAGLDHASGDAIVLMDADLQHPPELIEEFVDEWRSGSDVVYAVRRSRDDETWFKTLASKWFYRLFKAMSEIPPQVDAADFRLMDRRVADSLNKLREVNRFNKGLFSWVGYKQTAIPYTPGRREDGGSRWSFKRLFNLSINGLISFSTLPLRLVALAGVVMFVIAFIFLIWIVLEKIFFGLPVSGYPTMMVTILFLGGFQFLFLGIVGEYVGQILSEVKGRPLYIVAETIETGKPVEISKAKRKKRIAR